MPKTINSKIIEQYTCSLIHDDSFGDKYKIKIKSPNGDFYWFSVSGDATTDITHRFYSTRIIKDAQEKFNSITLEDIETFDRYMIWKRLDLKMRRIENGDKAESDGCID